MWFCVLEGAFLFHVLSFTPSFRERGKNTFFWKQLHKMLDGSWTNDKKSSIIACDLPRLTRNLTKSSIWKRRFFFSFSHSFCALAWLSFPAYYAKDRWDWKMCTYCAWNMDMDISDIINNMVAAKKLHEIMDILVHWTSEISLSAVSSITVAVRFIALDAGCCHLLCPLTLIIIWCAIYLQTICREKKKPSSFHYQFVDAPKLCTRTMTCFACVHLVLNYTTYSMDSFSIWFFRGFFRLFGSVNIPFGRWNHEKCLANIELFSDRCVVCSE